MSLIHNHEVCLLHAAMLTLGSIMAVVFATRQEFHDLEPDTTMRALQALEAIGKCAIVQGDSSDSMVSYRILDLGQSQLPPMPLLFPPFLLTILLLIICRELNLLCKLILVIHFSPRLELLLGLRLLKRIL